MKLALWAVGVDVVMFSQLWVGPGSSIKSLKARNILPQLASSPAHAKISVFKRFLYAVFSDVLHYMEKWYRAGMDHSLSVCENTIFRLFVAYMIVKHNLYNFDRG